MVRDELHATCAALSRQDRDETVHLSVQLEVVRDLPADGFERATQIVDRKAGRPRDQRVGELGREFSAEPGVLSVASPAVHQVIAFLQLGEQQGDVRRIILKVAVDRHNHVAHGVFQAGLHRRGLAVVAPEEDHADVRILLGECGESWPAVVRRTVIDENQLIFNRERP